jgi:hypothetical protein
LWESLVGRKLFDGATDYETYTRLRDCMVQPLRPLRGDVPQPFVAIVQRALARDADARFPSAREMARQIGTTLKKVQLRKDLHTVLAKTVEEAREGMGLGVRTGDPSSATPVAQLISENNDTPRIELVPKLMPATNVTPAAGSALDRLRGLRHRLPFFGKRKA